MPDDPTPIPTDGTQPAAPSPPAVPPAPAAAAPAIVPAPAPAPREGLSIDSIRRVEGFLFQLRVGLTRLQLYPPGTPQAARTATTIYGPLAECLDSLQALTLSEAENLLIANGTPVPSEGAGASLCRFVIETLHHLGVKSLTFRIGLSLDEMKIFLEEANLRRLGKKGADAPNFSDSIQALGVAHVTVNERIFVSVSERDLVIESGAVLLERSGDGIDAIMRIVQEVMDLTNVQNAQIKDQTRVQIAKQILQENPNLLPQLLEKKGEPFHPSEKPEPATALILVEAVAETTNLYQEMRRRFPAGTPEAVLADRVRILLQRLLALGEGKVETLAIYREMLDKGSLDGMATVPGADQERAGPVREATDLVDKDPLTLIDERVRDTLPKLIRELDVAERYDLAEKLLDRFSENLVARTADIRRKAVQGMAHILDALESTAKPDLARRADKRLLSAQEEERDEGTYSTLSSILERRAGSLLKEGDFGGVGEVLGLIRRHRDVRNRAFEQRPLLADQAMERLAKGDLTSVLLDDLKSSDTARQDRARELFVKMGDLALKALIEEVKKSEDLRVRHLLVLVIRSIGEDGVARLIEATSEERAPLVIARLLDVVRSVGMEDMVFESLKGLAHHPVPQVRLEVLDTLHKMGGAKASVLALEALRDEDVRVQALAAKILGELKSPEAVGPITAILAPRGFFGGEINEDLLESAVLALGSIGNDQSLPILLEVLQAVSKIPFRKGRTARVRVSAARALLRFSANPQVWEVLTHTLQDRDPYVRSAVQGLLQEAIMRPK